MKDCLWLKVVRLRERAHDSTHIVVLGLCQGWQGSRRNELRQRCGQGGDQATAELNSFSNVFFYKKMFSLIFFLPNEIQLVFFMYIT
jgi:hypothetical protein